MPDVRFHRVKDDPVVATAVPAPAIGGASIGWAVSYATEAFGDGGEYSFESELLSFPTDQRFLVTANVNLTDDDAFAGSSLSGMITCSAGEYVNRNGLQMLVESGVRAPSLSVTAVIDVRANQDFTIGILGQAGASYVPFNVNLSWVNVEHQYVPDT